MMGDLQPKPFAAMSRRKYTALEVDFLLFLSDFRDGGYY